MENLTDKQKSIIKYLQDGNMIYVHTSGDKYSYTRYPEGTHSRLYTTLSCRSLVERGICEHDYSCHIHSDQDHVAVLRLRGDYDSNNFRRW